MQINALGVLSLLITNTFKLFFKRLQTVKKEQQPFWEMIQAAEAEHQIITHLGPIRSLIKKQRDLQSSL